MSTHTADAHLHRDQHGTPIRSLTVLPAVREDVELHTADGLTLVGELALPVGPDGAPTTPAATLVTLHPLPTHGGYMDSHVFRKAAWRLPALAGLAVLRFNTRGTSSPRGTSDGAFDGGAGERYDVHAAIEFAEFHDLPHRWLVGWSFGTELALMHGRDPSIEGAILLSPPLHRATDADLDAWAAFGKPLVVLVPEHDDYLQPDEARTRFARVPQAEVIGVDGAKHLWVGETAVRRVLDEIVAHVLPGTGPLPTHWDGPSSTATSGLAPAGEEDA
ncbi:alpha/beta hydrolase [Cellulomonas sp.]|uniref:alpha/beta hydrolase n=1 Tax=Cellulomonas sp. TaxID=40001 RepID=UPI001B2E0CD4|nr:alpha/beta hydrolase [Cellulomonas sp.]MBO9556518.1 alpha/beta hydrolase [Cellulomonas sp.]